VVEKDLVIPLIIFQQNYFILMVVSKHIYGIISLLQILFLVRYRIVRIVNPFICLDFIVFQPKIIISHINFNPNILIVIVPY
jgi:hypothetical protein